MLQDGHASVRRMGSVLGKDALSVVLIRCCVMSEGVDWMRWKCASQSTCPRRRRGSGLSISVPLLRLVLTFAVTWQRKLSRKSPMAVASSDVMHGKKWMEGVRVVKPSGCRRWAGVLSGCCGNSGYV